MIGKAIVFKLPHKGSKDPGNGVYIQDTDGYFHTESEWDGTYTPNGVAVITDNCRFVISLGSTRANCQWSNSEVLIDGVLATTDKNAAILDFDGSGNTDKIVSQIGENGEAARSCWLYRFPDGSKGYMGAAGEWNTVLQNLRAIESALEKCGGSYFYKEIWTSTQRDAVDAYTCITVNVPMLNWRDKRTSDYFTRAFAAI